jgi:Sucrase/ferredoxin-like
VRLVLIRKPQGSRRQAVSLPSCFSANASAGSVGLWRVPISGPGDLLELDWELLTAPGPEGAVGSGAVRESEPLFLVCTNGARDVCCAERGRPLMGALRVAVGDRAWECSHIGGDRFAGNLVCFPHGMYFGRLGSTDVAAVARAYVEGRVDLERYRGRGGLGFAAQAAEHALRVRTGLDGVDDLRLVGMRRWEDGGGLEAEFATGARVLRVSMRTVRASPPRPLTCKSSVTLRPAAYEVVSIDTP